MEKSFGYFLMQKRKEKKLTQKELAQKLYVSESAVSKWEKDVAHPDITLLPKLAEILNVTEHELITASVDEQNKKNIANSKKWERLSISWNMFFLIAYAITILVCFICNLATTKSLTWFWIVASGIILSASFTTFPRYIKRNKLLFVSLSELGSLILLLLVCNLYSHQNWFFVATFSVLFVFVSVMLPIFISNYKELKLLNNHRAVFCCIVDYLFLLLLYLFICEFIKQTSWFIYLALPLTLICFALVILMIVIIRYLSVNRLLKTSFCLTLWTIFYSVCGSIIEVMLRNSGLTYENNSSSPFNPNFKLWTDEFISNNVNFIIFLTLTVLSVIFLIIGLFRLKKNKKSKIV